MTRQYRGGRQPRAGGATGGARKLPANQRVVKSIKDSKGNVYSKTAEGGKGRVTAATRYMDKHEQSQLYAPDERGAIRETDRTEAVDRVDNTDTKYQQHLVMTTELSADQTYVDRAEYAQDVADSIRAVKPDADIYAISVHVQNENGEDKIHAHVTFGTQTTMQHSQLERLREEAYKHEQHISERGRDREFTPEERDYGQARTTERTQDATRSTAAPLTPQRDDVRHLAPPPRPQAPQRPAQERTEGATPADGQRLTRAADQHQREDRSQEAQRGREDAALNRREDQINREAQRRSDHRRGDPRQHNSLEAALEAKLSQAGRAVVDKAQELHARHQLRQDRQHLDAQRLVEDRQRGEARQTEYARQGVKVQATDPDDYRAAGYQHRKFQAERDGISAYGRTQHDAARNLGAFERERREYGPRAERQRDQEQTPRTPSHRQENER